MEVIGTQPFGINPIGVGSEIEHDETVEVFSLNSKINDTITIPSNVK